MAKKRVKSRLGISDQKLIDKLHAENNSISSIARTVNVSAYVISNYIKSKEGTEGDLDLPVKIRLQLEKNSTFGRFIEETQAYIVDLYREDIPSNFIADLLGLKYSYKNISENNAGFSEKPKLTFQDQCRQAQAEAAIKTIMVARSGEKSADAIRFLEKSEATRDLYKATKEEKGTIKIEMPGFAKGIQPTVLKDDEKPEKLN